MRGQSTNLNAVGSGKGNEIDITHTHTHTHTAEHPSIIALVATDITDSSNDIRDTNTFLSYTLEHLAEFQNGQQYGIY